MWGLNESVKKGRITFYRRDWDNPLGQVWTCMGALGIAINKRPRYPQLIIFWSTSRLCSCGGSTLVSSAPAPVTTWRHVGGMRRRSRLKSISIPSLGGGWVDRHPSFSLFSISYLIFPYHTLGLGISSNSLVAWTVWLDSGGFKRNKNGKVNVSAEMGWFSHDD